jgi:hypothetical protein
VHRIQAEVELDHVRFLDLVRYHMLNSIGRLTIPEIANDLTFDHVAEVTINGMTDSCSGWNVSIIERCEFFVILDLGSKEHGALAVLIKRADNLFDVVDWTVLATFALDDNDNENTILLNDKISWFINELQPSYLAGDEE